VGHVEQCRLIRQSHAPIFSAGSTLILYEYPFNESIRTFLRLEQLFKRMAVLIFRDDPIDHHFALHTLFEVMDVGSRADIKSDLMRELERFKGQFESYRGNPAIQEGVLDDVLTRIHHAHQSLNLVAGKFGQHLNGNEWLMSIRSRISIPGGTCEFDLPAYYDWQQHPAAQRREAIQGWVAGLAPLHQGLELVLSLLRDTGRPHMVAAPNGHFHHSLKEGRSFSLLRLRIDPALGLIPEISGNRLMVVVRLMREDAEGKLKQVHEGDPSFELTLCG
jgi:cell division protein ZapD